MVEKISVTEADVAKIAAAKLNLVNLPYAQEAVIAVADLVP